LSKNSRYRVFVFCQFRNELTLKIFVYLQIVDEDILKSQLYSHLICQSSGGLTFENLYLHTPSTATRVGAFDRELGLWSKIFSKSTRY